MLGDSKAFSGFAVDDLDEGEGVLRATRSASKTSEEHGLLTLHLGGRPPDAGVAEARLRASHVDHPEPPRRRHRRGRRRADRARRRV